MSVTIGLATRADDAAVRRLVASSPVPGRVEVTYEREPDYFLGCRAMGPFFQVLAARDDETGEVVAVASRASRERYVDGVPREVGYLGQLRVARSHRGRWLVSRGFRFLRGLHDDGRVDTYLVSVTAEGREARGLLVDRRREHFPVLREIDTLHTLAIEVPARRRAAVPPQAATPDAVEEAAALLVAEGSRKQYFPVVTAGALREGALPGLDPEDLVVVRRRGRVAAVAALWDQSAFKQTVVRGYPGALRRLRPAYNLAARLRGRQPLPGVGERLRYAFASLVCVENDEARLFEELLGALKEAAGRRGLAYVMVGLCGRDPLLATAARHPHVRYTSTVYEAGWEAGGAGYERHDGGVAYVDIGML